MCRQLRRSIVVFAAIAFSTVLQAQVYGIAYDTGVIYQINTSTAAITYIASTGVENIADLVAGPDGMVYGYTTGANATLYKFDPDNGWNDVSVGALGNGFYYEGALAINSSGVVYGANNGMPTADNLFTLNLNTGAASIGPQLSASADFNGFDFRADGTLVGIDRVSDALDSINVTTGQITQIAALPIPLGEVGGMTTDIDESYFCTSGPGGVLPGNNSFYGIDETTGATNLIGAFGAAITDHGISGLVSLTPTASPEPNGFLALGGACVLIGLRRRRRSSKSTDSKPRSARHGGTI